MPEKINDESFSSETGDLPLKGFKVVSLANNLPGPVAASRLRELGAEVIKIEPPQGDPFQHYSAAWYRELTRGQRVITLDLKAADQREHLDRLLQNSDLLITSMRLAALERLKLDRAALDKTFPHLLQISFVGYASDAENVAGHDLTYQASLGLLSPPQMPRTLLTDLAAAERAVSAALSLILARERGLSASYAQISIAEAAGIFAAPFRFGLTSPEGLLGGGFAGYNLYQTRQGWIAVAALEPKFKEKLLAELRISDIGREKIQTIFLTKTAAQWEEWANARDIPLKAVSDPV